MKTKLSVLSLLIAIIAIAIASCKKDQRLANEVNANYSPTPVLPATTYDYPNSSRQNDKVATLGRVLFYDRSLSLNNTVACASCHQQEKAFCDNQQFSTGLENVSTPRNAPSIFAKSGRMFWDGRANNLRNLVLAPIQNHIEMKFQNLNSLVTRLSKIDYYAPLFKDAFGTADIDSMKIKTALAEFIINFNFSQNKFNRSEKNQEALSASEGIGRRVFFDKGRCFNCHNIQQETSIFVPDTMGNGNGGNGNGYGFTDESFNIGLDETYADNGLGTVTRNSNDNGKFMVPVLLNVALTAPYMHDGRFKTLEDVVEHYNSGIKNHPNLDFALRNTDIVNNMSESQIMATYDTNHDGQIEPSEVANIMQPVKLNLTDVEKKGLVDFLKTLTDGNILTDAKFKNPFLKNN